MTAANTEVKVLYEEGGLAPGEIATELGWDIESVKATLLQFSAKYRLAMSTAANPAPTPADISDDEYQDILRTYKEIALNSEVDSVRERACRNLINERKGRNDIKMVQHGNINITIFNQHLLMARRAASIRQRQKQVEAKTEQHNLAAAIDI